MNSVMNTFKKSNDSGSINWMVIFFFLLAEWHCNFSRTLLQGVIAAVAAATTTTTTTTNIC